ncbi:MAG: DUF4845 domain-containing protein, partial [Gammaproteobacteria bacterium]|nr:DUF4845 domain-containing protein [Gammaproteobacteria bacterium]
GGVMNRKKQIGATFITWLMLAGILGFLAVAGLKLIPVYMEYGTIVSVMEDVAKEQSPGKKSPTTIWKSIDKRLHINNVRYIKKENFKYERGNLADTMTIKYEVRTPLFGNLDAVAKFEKSMDVKTLAE